MTTFSGTVYDPDGNAQANADVLIIDSDTNAVEAETTTDSNGQYSVDVPGGSQYHVATQYDDGSGNQFNALSKPFIDTASEQLLIEDWESGNYSDYNVIDGSGMTIVTDEVYEGTYAAEYSGNSWQNIISDSLPNLPSRGDTIRWYAYCNDSMCARIQYGLQSATSRDNCYNCRFEVRDQRVRIESRSGGSSTTLAEDTSMTLPADEWCRIEVEWVENANGNTDLTATFWDSSDTEITSISGTDTTHNYTSGNFGWGLWGSSTGTRTLVDYATIV